MTDTLRAAAAVVILIFGMCFGSRWENVGHWSANAEFASRSGETIHGAVRRDWNDDILVKDAAGVLHRFKASEMAYIMVRSTEATTTTGLIANMFHMWRMTLVAGIAFAGAGILVAKNFSRLLATPRTSANES